MVIPALIVFSLENQSASEYPGDPSGATFFLGDLFVRESFHRRGIGKALLTGVARIAVNGNDCEVIASDRQNCRRPASRSGTTS